MDEYGDYGKEGISEGGLRESGMMDNPIDVSVVIVTYKSKDPISRCIQSIRESSEGISVEIIIVDNASCDGIVELVRAEFPEVTVIENKKNVGFARGVNQGVNRATGRYLNILNPDTRLLPETLKILLNFLEKHPWDCVAGARTVDEMGRVIPSCRSLPHIGNIMRYPISLLLRGKRLRKPRRFLLDLWDQGATIDATKLNGYLTGACMMMKSEFFRKMGMFDEQYFVYAEDADFGLRVARAGSQSFLLGETFLIHFKGHSSSQNPRSWLYAVDAYIRYIHKNFTFFHGMAYKIGLLIFVFTWVLRMLLKGNWQEAPILLQTLRCFVPKRMGGPPPLPEQAC